MEKICTTIGYKQTQDLGEFFAKEIEKISSDRAVILGLRGNLGGGKTTFLQGFAKGLGVKEKILSPTFVIQKRFRIKAGKQAQRFDNFYHIDCYRLKNEKDIAGVDFRDIISDAKNIIAVEWPEKIRKILPKNIIYIDFKLIDENAREIIFKI